MSVILDVNMDNVVVFANKLERLNKTAFPNAVRTALNSAAFDVKTNTLLSSASKNFQKRQPNFFRANSRVKMAQGMAVNSMESMVGMVSLGGNNHAVDDLEQQEHGGRIGGRSFIPLNKARTSGQYSKRVAKRYRIGTVKNMVNSRDISAANNKQRFIKSIYAAGPGGHVLHDGILWRVESLIRKRNGMFKIKPLYSFKKGRSVKVSATHFMENASMESASRLEKFFSKAAKTQFNKALK